MNDMDKRRIIVSITSYPKRIGFVDAVLGTIDQQTKAPDLVILWLAGEQFPNREKSLPGNLLQRVETGKLTIKWCDDLKPHKKYFYAFQQFPEDLIITIDDDILYPPDLIENLYQSYLRHPNAVSATRVHFMIYDQDEGILPYETWIKEYTDIVDVESMLLFCTGGAGALYPVHLLNPSLLNEAVIYDNCLHADDIWLKFMEIEANVPVVLACKYDRLIYVDESQEEALYYYNITKNDEQFRRCVEWFDRNYRRGMIDTVISEAWKKENMLTVDVAAAYYTGRLRRLQREINDLRGSRSYRIGRAITWPARKIRDLKKPSAK